MKIRKEIKERLNSFIETRRYLHQNPEIGFNTQNTLKYIENLLNLKSASNDNISGIFYFEGSKPCIAFRCELDALSIQETNEVDYKSKNQYMHACGHDAHMAILIETMHYFMKNKQEHALLFIFQPAEESGAGSKYIIKQDIFKKYDVKELYAYHVLPGLGNKIGCKEGIIMSRSCEIQIIIDGKSAHAAHKDKGIDALYASTLFLKFVYTLQIKPNILHIGKMNSGEVCNVISSKSILEGTIRAFNNEDFEFIKKSCILKLKEIDNQLNTTSIISFSDGYDCLINDFDLVQKVKMNSDDYIEIEPMALSEDFSFYNGLCKCCYYFCGLTSEIDLHDSCFDLNEEECLKAVELNVRLVENNEFVL